MELQRQLRKIISAAHGCGLDEIVALQPYAASLQSVLHTRALALQQQAGMPDTDYLLNTEEVAVRLGKSTKWVRDNVELLPFAFQVGKEHRFSVRGLEEWIAEQRAAKMAQALPPQRRQQDER